MPHTLPCNEVRLLRGGDEFFPALLEAIAAARTSIYLETYIYDEDATAARVTAALAAAARRGVQVRVTVDGFGSHLFAPAYREEFAAAGVALAVFRPETGLWWPSRSRLRRMHRKLALIDEEIGFVGGINILDDRFDPHHGVLDAPRFDFAVRVRGPVVRDITLAMLSQWLRVGWLHSHGTSRFARHLMHLTRAPWPPGPGQQRARFLIRDNLRHRVSIERAYLLAIGRARRDLIISNAYFLPGRRFRKALRHAVARGVRVRLLLQGRTEYVLQQYATQALYKDLLALGIEIHEYQRSFLHAKVAVVDDAWATVGSSNIDPFSLLLAREANLVVHDRDFTAELRAALESAITTDALRIVPTHYQRRPALVRAFGLVAYGLLRLGVLLTGQGGRY